jgi:tetratricopeptide (TPR) repeat protein
MATIPRCLCVILTLWMVSTRPSASILPGASASGALWGTPESPKFARLADRSRRAGDLTAAEAFYKQGLDDAVRRHDQRAIVGYLNGIAACRLTQLRYRQALETLLEAKSHARLIGDEASLGAIAVNLSIVYHQCWDFEAALREAEEGRVAAATLRKPYFLPNLLVQLGRLHEKQADGSAPDLYRQGIVAARAAGDKQVEAIGLDLLGAYLLSEVRLGHGGHLGEAEKAIVDGLRLREKQSPKDLGFSWGWMGELQRLRGNLADAAHYTDLALNSTVKIPEYLLRHQRGEIRMASGDRAGALADFRAAIDLATHWRLEVLPVRSSLTAANEELERRVFSSFIEAAAGEALRTGSQRWAREAFEAVELNRAASLRESRVLADAWHRRVPPEYWETRARLDKQPGRDESRRLRLELAEMEAKAGLGFSAKNSEIFRDQTSLIHFQQGLGSSEVLLSFYLGKKESYLWAVTRDSFELQKIVSSSVIQTRVLALSDAVRAGRPEAVELGETLYKELFGQLGREAAARPSWMLSLEGTLFEAPFAALVTERKGGKVNYLVSKHSVQTIPGALLLSKRPDAGTGWFLGVGDPVYNAADPRWGVKKSSVQFLFQTLTGGAGPAQFSRLIGSADELKTSADNWGGRSAVLLQGTDARKSVFLRQLEGVPSVIHLATHVIPSLNAQASIAFGLGPQGQSEFLTTTDVSSLRVPGAFVAMTGCNTASGEFHPGAGLQGLTTAWQMAGASAVLATSWPVRDSSGDILASFYKYLQHVPAAQALRLSQLEMLDSGSWRAAPSYWATYQITGGAR